MAPLTNFEPAHIRPCVSTTDPQVVLCKHACTKALAAGTELELMLPCKCTRACHLVVLQEPSDKSLMRMIDMPALWCNTWEVMHSAGEAVAALVGVDRH